MESISCKPHDRVLANDREKRNRQEALCMFLVEMDIFGTFVMGNQDDNMTRKVCDFKEPYWRVRYQDEYWEKMTTTEMERYR